MSSFCILREPGSPRFSVQKFDLNLWILPGLLGGRVIYCDLGLKLQLLANAEVSRRSEPPVLDFRLGLPFTIRGSVMDLSRLFYVNGSKSVFNAVFGNDAQPNRDENNNVVYNDGDGLIAVCSIDDQKSRIEEQVRNPAYSLLHLSVTSMANADQSDYVRIRFRVESPGRLWSWHNVTRRRTFAISDIRANEFRETPKLDKAIDFSSWALPIASVHCLVIFSTKLRIGQVSPQLRYVRVLERSIWEPYLGRRLSKSKEVFVTTYWKGEEVTVDSPFRAFLEVERRRANALMPSILFSALVLAAFILASPIDSLADSVGWKIVESVWSVKRAITIAGIITAITLIREFGPRFETLRSLYEKAENRYFEL